MRKALVRGLAVITLMWMAAPSAQAATRVVLVPVVIGSGGSEPDLRLMMALGNGLKQNPQWAVEQGDGLEALGRATPTSLTAEALGELTSKVDGAGRDLEGETAAATLTAARDELLAAGRKAPRGQAGDDLTYRAGGLLAAALLAKKDSAGARKIADETALLFPGRKPSEADHLPEAAAHLLGTPTPNMGATLTLRSRPEGCEVVLGGHVLGKAPLEVAVLPGEVYYGQARCPAGAATPSGPSPTPLASVTRKISVPPGESTRSEILDVEFERGFAAEGLRRLRFSSPQERRDLEESYARRLAERLDAEVVVLASLGELSGADWLSARLYLRSGYLNRQGFVRLEPLRANALGRYLATGKEVPGVLRPEEAGQLVAASQRAPKPHEAEPWYTDVAGWCVLGAGIASVSLGYYANKVADRRRDAWDLEPDPDKRIEGQMNEQSARTWGGIGTYAGFALIGVGIVLLAVPQQSSDDSETFALGPTLLPGGGGLTLGGRF